MLHLLPGNEKYPDCQSKESHFLFMFKKKNTFNFSRYSEFGISGTVSACQLVQVDVCQNQYSASLRSETIMGASA